MRQCRRAMIAAGGRPLFTRELLRWAYPRIERFQCWHYWSVGPNGRDGQAASRIESLG
jgi:hypothetical protein